MVKMTLEGAIFHTLRSDHSLSKFSFHKLVRWRNSILLPLIVALPRVTDNSSILRKTGWRATASFRRDSSNEHRLLRIRNNVRILSG